MQLLTASRLKAYRRCQRYHHHRYVEGYRPVTDSEALRFGTLMHRGLEVWWRELLEDPAIDEHVQLERAVDELAVEKDPYVRIRAEVLLAGYHLMWRDEGLVPLAMEQPFECDLVNPKTGAASRTYRLAGKIDVLARTRDGRVVVIEHKTAGVDIGVGSTYWQQLRLDGQVSTYFAGGDALGRQPGPLAGITIDDCIYDVIAKPKIEPREATPVEKRETTTPKFRACALCKKKGATPAPHKVTIGDAEAGTLEEVECGAGATVTLPDGQVVAVDGEPGKILAEVPRYKAHVRIADETVTEYGARIEAAIQEDPAAFFVRGWVPRLVADKLGHALDMWAIAEQLRDGRKGHPPKNPDGCMSFGRPCEFLAVCSGAASLEDPALFIRIDNVHPELEAPAPPAPVNA
jgi:hypothetical protein